MRSVQSTGYNSHIYEKAKDDCVRIGATEGIDAALERHNLDALVIPSEGWASAPTAIAGTVLQFRILEF